MSRPPSSLSSFGSDTNVMAVSDTLCVVSPTNPISYEPSVDEIPGAQLPGEIPGLLSCESGHNLGGKSHITTLESVNSTFGSAESTQSFDEDEDEVHDFLEKDELSLMQDMFKSMDLDGAGKIRWEQARVVMAKMGRKMTDDQFAKLVDRYDIDKNGDLEFSEFCSMYLDHMRRRVKNNDTLLEVFAFLDRNEHGRVCRDDLETCLEIANVQLSQEDLDIMLQHIGLDDDGTVCEGMFVMNTLGIQRIQYNVASLLGISATV